jgi:Tfp pilus assembly protein PilN
MRAVNLLPEKHRPRRPTGGQRGSSYVVLGVLGAVVVAVLLYVLTANSINQAKTDIASAKDEAARANAQAQQLGAYGDFAKVKAQRVEAVKQLAGSRMDWERLVRELATVLPDGVWIQNASASDSAADAAGSTGASSTSTPSSGGATAAADGPSLTLQGCAPDQRTVADTLVRLREVQGANDVKLEHSAAPVENPGASGSSTPAPAPSGGSAGSGDCGTTHGKPNYEFQAIVNFDPPAPAPNDGPVPERLGGGQ